jgi:hypothetical protein
MATSSPGSLAAASTARAGTGPSPAGSRPAADGMAASQTVIPLTVAQRAKAAMGACSVATSTHGGTLSLNLEPHTDGSNVSLTYRAGGGKAQKTRRSQGTWLDKLKAQKEQSGGGGRREAATKGSTGAARPCLPGHLCYVLRSSCDGY